MPPVKKPVAPRRKLKKVQTTEVYQSHAPIGITRKDIYTVLACGFVIGFLLALPLGILYENNRLGELIESSTQFNHVLETDYGYYTVVHINETDLNNRATLKIANRSEMQP